MPEAEADSRGAARPGASVGPWLELLRVPNLPTVPGDPLVGLVLAAAATGVAVSGRQALGVAVAALCLYMAGLVLNDLHDLPDDRRQRPERPLARGAIGVRRAGLACGLLAALGLVAAVLAGGWRSGLAATALLGLVACYDLCAKARPASACLVMGLCRGGSVLLGASAGGSLRAAAVPALAWTVYIGAVTWLSRREDETQRPGVPVLVPPLTLAGGCLGVWLLRPPACHLGLAAALACGGLALVTATRTSLTLFRQAVPPAAARAAVGQFIGLLLPWQAALIVVGGTPGATATAMGLLAAWPLSRALARRVSAS